MEKVNLHCELNNANASGVWTVRYSLFAMALSYIVLFVIYGALLPAPVSNTLQDKVGFILEHQGMLKISFLVGYVGFGCLLTAVSIGFYRTCEPKQMSLNTHVLIWGLFWALLLIATGLIGLTNISLLSAKIVIDDWDAASSLFYSGALLEQALGGGIEFVGGVWVLLIGLVVWQQRVSGMLFPVFSGLKGTIGVLTIISSESVLRDLFGITGIIWFIWFDVVVVGVTTNNENLEKETAR